MKGTVSRCELQRESGSGESQVRGCREKIALETPGEHRLEWVGQ